MTNDTKEEGNVKTTKDIKRLKTTVYVLLCLLIGMILIFIIHHQNQIVAHQILTWAFYLFIIYFILTVADLILYIKNENK